MLVLLYPAYILVSVWTQLYRGSQDRPAMIGAIKDISTRGRRVDRPAASRENRQKRP